MISYWLSFRDPDRPTGHAFSGVCIVDLDERDIEAEGRRLARLDLSPLTAGLRLAINKAWFMACNPGGEVAGSALNPGEHRDVPRDKLMLREELERRGLI